MEAQVGQCKDYLPFALFESGWLPYGNLSVFLHTFVTGSRCDTSHIPLFPFCFSVCYELGKYVKSSPGNHWAYMQSP